MKSWILQQILKAVSRVIFNIKSPCTLFFRKNSCRHLDLAQPSTSTHRMTTLSTLNALQACILLAASATTFRATYVCLRAGLPCGTEKYFFFTVDLKNGFQSSPSYKNAILDFRINVSRRIAVVSQILLISPYDVAYVKVNYRSVWKKLCINKKYEKNFTIFNFKERYYNVSN
jgi:hypothetical protein